jgi:hypothetical protein
MKKKLINFDAFKQLEKTSITNSERELLESTEILANVLALEWLDVFCVNESNVTFIDQNGEFVYANYEIDNNNIVLENIEQLVVDKSSTETSLRKNLEEMVNNILEDKLDEASSNFSDYFRTPMLRAELREGTINEAKKGGGLPPWLKAHFEKKAKKSGKKMEVESEKDAPKTRRAKKKKRLHKGRLEKVGKGMKNKAKMESLNLLANNVIEYITFKENGNVYNNVSIKRDSLNNVVALKIPVSKARNEGAIIKAQSEKHTRFISESRESAKLVAREGNWVRACTDLKRFNAISDNKALETAFENVASAWPNLLFLTEAELATKIKETLTNSGASNFDDSTCEFLAEGILRTAHRAYTDNVTKITSVVGAMTESNDYNHFSKVAEKVLTSVDNNTKLETQVFSDLYRGLSEVYRAAERIGDEATKAETASLLSDVELVLNGEEKDTIRVAEEAALYIQTVTEAALNLDGMTWHVASPHESETGDNPAIHGYADVDAVPGKHTGKFKSSPFSDGKTVRTGTEDHYTSMKGKDLFPNMENPYAPKPGDFKMHGEKAIEDDKEYTKYSGSDVFPALKNPYIPDHGMTMQDSLHLMKAGE